MSGSVDTDTENKPDGVEDRTYQGGVENWAAVQPLLQLWFPEPRFVYAFTASEWDDHLVVALYSYDRTTFSAVVRHTNSVRGKRKIVQPLARVRPAEIERKLIGTVPELLSSLPRIRDWMTGLQLKYAPELIAVAGSELGVYWLLRDALGLDPKQLGQSSGRVRLLRVSPSQYVAIRRLADSKGMSIITEVLDVRG